MSGGALGPDLEALDAELRRAYALDGEVTGRLRKRVERLTRSAAKPAPRPDRPYLHFVSYAIAGLLLVAAGAGMAIRLSPGIPSRPVVTDGATPRVMPSASPVAKCGGATAGFQALLWTGNGQGGRGDLSLYESTSAAGLKHLASGDRLARFVGTADFSWLDGLVRRAPLSDPGAAGLIPEAAGTRVYGWSPDGQDLAWVQQRASTSPGGGNLTLVLKRGASAASVLTVGDPLPATEAGRDFDETISYSPDGRYFVVSENGPAMIGPAGHAMFQVRSADGTLVWDPVTAGGVNYSMPVWNRQGTALYFNAPAGLSRLDLSTLTTAVVAGVKVWYEPSLSPDGCAIAFVTRDIQDFIRTGKPTIHVLDLASETERTVASGVSGPQFVSNSTLWAYAEASSYSQFAGPDTWGTTGALVAVDIGSGTSTDLHLTVSQAIFDTQTFVTRVKP